MVAREPRLVTLAEIEAHPHFTLAWNGQTPPVYPNPDGPGWLVRVVVRELAGFDHFHVDDDGTLLGAPWGYAKDFKPGRMDVDELLAAWKSYMDGARSAVAATQTTKDGLS